MLVCWPIKHSSPVVTERSLVILAALAGAQSYEMKSASPQSLPAEGCMKCSKITFWGFPYLEGVGYGFLRNCQVSSLPHEADCLESLNEVSWTFLVVLKTFCLSSKRLLQFPFKTTTKNSLDQTMGIKSPREENMCNNFTKKTSVVFFRQGP